MIFIIASFLLRIIIASYNYFYGPIPGAEFDALNFHYEALEYTRYLENKSLGIEDEYNYRIGWYYSNFLGFFYYYSKSEQLLLASIFSCTVWLLSSLIFLKTLNIFEINKSKVYFIVFIYCWMFPTSFVYNSITLREPYILLCFNILLYEFICFYMKGFNIFRIIILILTISIFCLLHDANIFFMIIFSGFSIYLYLIQKFFGKEKIFIIFIITLIILIFFSELLNFNLNESLFNKILKYRKGHFGDSGLARAFYDSILDLKDLKYNFIFYLKFLATNFFNYFLQPLPFRATSLKDFVLIIENSFRFFLFILIFINFYKFDKIDSKNKLLHSYILFALILMEFIYAQATINWGTASRHHSVTLGLLIFLSLPFNKKLRKK